MARIFTLASPSGDDLKFYRLNGEEALGRPFEWRIEALAASHNVSLRELLGKAVTVRVELAGGGERYLNGIVSRASLVGRHAGRYYAYELIVRPWLWLASRSADCRIFQEISVPQIVQQVLSPYGYPIENRLTETYALREYCVQYNETDLDFVSRLMEAEGIYYFFRHEAGTHTLVLCDAMASHSDLPGYATIPYIGRDRAAIADEEHIDNWQPVQEVSAGRREASDYDYTKPHADLGVRRAEPRGHDHDDYSVYEWPGGYRDDAHGAQRNRVRLEELQGLYDRAQAHTDVRASAPGYLFELERCPRADQNRKYLIVRCTYRFQENPYASHTGNEPVLHEADLLAQPDNLPYRTPRTTPVPHTNGPQTAVVVGPPGEEIWTDRYGRVKLQFHWDRYGRRDQDSSCWVRVSSPWAGGGFGGVQIPRVGDEVIVDFLNGDPDYPIVTGRVYNAASMPPWNLPASATQSGLLSRSTPGGTVEHANALRFEDRKGSEQFWMHAERNFDAETELDHTLSVGHDHTHTVGNDETMQVKNNRQRSVGQTETVNIGQHRVAQIGGDETTSVGGSHSVTVKGNSTHTVTDGNHSFTVANGTHTVQVEQTSTHMVAAGSRIVDVAVGDYSVTAANAVLVYGKKLGVGITGDGGVGITGSKLGVDVNGNDGGVGITGDGKGRGVAVTGTGKGVVITGTPFTEVYGTTNVDISAPTVNVGDQDVKQVNINAKKIVISTQGASIELDASGITIQGTIAHIN
ncbi:type VI secretion system tip protein VgrG [Paraburkholderia guartelaensis]|uniref:Type VI secretion system tip protein VgrG n=1 Tax=Paraburkholderia guartelaensis TaxID=2546446 RepID=A0A4R5L8Y7_9BURK|nr:type VI secretion system tip protein VgrG [Paraburkholderia guartelaensis]